MQSYGDELAIVGSSQERPLQQLRLLPLNLVVQFDDELEDGVDSIDVDGDDCGDDPNGQDSSDSNDQQVSWSSCLGACDFAYAMSRQQPYCSRDCKQCIEMVSYDHEF